MKNRFFIEKKNDSIDFPFYNGKPKKINTTQWLIILGVFFTGFLIYSFWVPHFPPAFTWLIVIVFNLMNLFFGIGSLSIFAGKDAFALFRKIKLKDILFLVGLLLIAFIYATIAPEVVNFFDPTKSNPAVVSHAQAHGLQSFLLNALTNIPSLLGEEFIALLPFLALLYFFYQRMHWSRNASIGLALLLSSLIFGLVHLPTYQWNWLQAIFVIGLGRVIVTSAYIRTKSIWASYIVHFTFDMVIFLLAFLA